VRYKSLRRTVLDSPHLSIFMTNASTPRRPLPLLTDILATLYEKSEGADYLVFTNADIGLQVRERAKTHIHLSTSLFFSFSCCFFERFPHRSCFIHTHTHTLHVFQSLTFTRMRLDLFASDKRLLLIEWKYQRKLMGWYWEWIPWPKYYMY
jgi:hypothetical protein